MRRRPGWLGRMSRWSAVFGALIVMAGFVVTAPASARPGPEPVPEAAPWVQVNGNTNGCTTACHTSPPPRAASVMAYDAATHQMILFGGLGGGTSATFNDTWDWNGTRWTQLFPADSPPIRAASVMAYDTRTGQLVLFGGQGRPYANLLNDTWVWNGSNWTQVDDSTDPGCGFETHACTDSPPQSSGMSMGYDPATGQLVLFSGLRDTNETWDWNGSTWTQVDDATDPGCIDTCTASPPYSVAGDMAYDPASGQLVLFGGQEEEGNGTWDWNGSTWTQVDDTTRPGCGAFGDQCPASPSLRSGVGLTYDPTLGGLVLFGGLYHKNDTWLWNGARWTQIDDTTDPGCSSTTTRTTNRCTTAPPGRSVAALARDGSTGQLVLFGGQGRLSFLNDTWIIQSAPTPTTAPCIPGSHACQSGPGTSTTVTSDDVKVISTGRGTVAVGSYHASEVPALKSSTGKFFGVSVSSDNALKSLVVMDCSLGGGTALSWWNGKAWVHVVPEPSASITSSGGCLSVTLGTSSSPSIATLARLSRLSRFGAVVFGVT